MPMHLNNITQLPDKKEKQLQGKKAVKFAKAESKKELSAATYTCKVPGKKGVIILTTATP